MTVQKVHPHSPQLTQGGFPKQYLLHTSHYPVLGPNAFICRHCLSLYVPEDNKTGIGGMCIANVAPDENPPVRGAQPKK